MGVFDARSYREENGMDELCGDERAVVEMFFKAKLGVVNILSLTKRDLAVESSGSNAEAPKGTGTYFSGGVSVAPLLVLLRQQMLF
mmetsp:Transcript_25247/g.99678  ORF Transcript_25247/g.99678 Transcript_25247/m.99678 type:complete len:86 (-) Transcript_25247:1470-1727(-)